MRRAILALAFLLAIALPCRAQAKPNTLTPKEIADGWILLFDGETTFGWIGKGLKADGGALHFGDVGAALSSVQFASFEFRGEYQCDTDKTLLGVKGATPGVESFHGQFLPMQREWTPVRILVENQRIVIDVPGTEPETKSPFAWTDPCVIRINQGNDTKTKLRNIKLRPLNAKSLFNGKDLTGWKTFPGEKYKSKFAVVDNAINVKDGPGDLQTVGKYQDFILQLECISNGKHLNSGIFFRCRDNEYQNGYESQISNEFKAEPQKYLDEEYDPMTNKLVGKKEVVSNAFDFGTGAIYRRVPARKQMSKDGEWFGMTIVAHGNHLATWVNGVQVTDWTDNRPKSDNARTGCKLEAGHISIQGHDPTTDLSFKNFRIAEFSPAK